MSNKKKLKQRKKRQLKKAFKQAVKLVKVKEGFSPDYLPPYKEPAVDLENKHKERDQVYQEALDKVYGGTVTALTHYVNNHSSMTFKCSECGLIFFNKAGHMVGKNANQRHRCHKPYGTIYGGRSSGVSFTNTKSKKNKAPLDIAELDRMVFEDYTYRQIAKELQVNPKIIKWYFIKEGLL